MATSAILFNGDKVEHLDSLDDRPSRLRGSMLLWVDLPDSAANDVRHAASEFDLDEETAHRLLDPSDGVRFVDRGKYIHVTASTPGKDEDDESNEIECVVGQNWVITAHNRPAEVLDTFAELAEGSGRIGDLDGPMFLANLLEWVLAEHAAAFERVEAELEEFDSKGMRGEGEPEDQIEELVTLRLRVGRLRRSLVAHRALLASLAHPELEALGDSASARRFEVLIDRYEQTLQEARDARESIVGSFDVLIARTGHRTNEIVKVLTLASVIFLPGALLAGIMGMNFKPALFSHAWVFWLMIAIMIAIGATTVAVAKARDWV